MKSLINFLILLLLWIYAPLLLLGVFAGVIFVLYLPILTIGWCIEGLQWTGRVIDRTYDHAVELGICGLKRAARIAGRMYRALSLPLTAQS